MAAAAAAAACFALSSISSGSTHHHHHHHDHVKSPELWLTKRNSLSPKLLTVDRKSNLVTSNSNSRRRNLTSSICAEYRNGRGGGGGGGDFLAGFVLGGVVFGTVAYIFAPQIRRSILNEDEYGFRKARRPIYYDEGLERTRQTLNEKISQLNSAIDNVSSRLRGANDVPAEPTESDPEVEATL